jgi:NAD-dependent dihydropyrimidine dehydrogenase PreA subunit
MTYVITSACLDAREQTCIEVCPVDCIHDVGPMLLIDPVGCIDCGACESECPVQAIYPEVAVPDAEQPFVAINAAVAHGAGHAAALVDDQRPSHDGRAGSGARRTAPASSDLGSPE